MDNMNTFVTFRHKSTGVIADYPEHYADHPVFGFDLEPYNSEEYEEDKVVVGGHDVPVEQRAQTVATVRYDEMKVDELKEVLADRGLSTAGNKAELIERISADNSESNEDI